MPRGRTKKLKNSLHYKFILDCIEKDMNATEIKRALLTEKGMKVSTPTVSFLIKEVKRDGLNITHFKSDAEKTALIINDKLKELPELSSIFSRRNYILDNLLKRRQLLIDYENEGKRIIEMYKLLDDLSVSIKNNCYNISTTDSKQIQQNVKDINNKIEIIEQFVKANFKNLKPDASIENLIRLYTQDIHNVCAYVEQWTSKNEINALLERLCKELTKAAIESFGGYLKKEDPEIRKKCIEKFIENTENIINDIKDYELKLGNNN